MSNKSATNKTVCEPADNLADAQQLHKALSSLVAKIDHEWTTGTPLIPLTQPDCMWDDTYPQELAAARSLVNQTKRIAEAHELYHALASLVGKIDNQCKNGMPLIALGKLGGGMWNHKSPPELTAARELVKRLKRKYRGW